MGGSGVRSRLPECPHVRSRIYIDINHCPPTLKLVHSFSGNGSSRQYGEKSHFGRKLEPDFQDCWHISNTGINLAGIA
ncbi:MAG: hypothetical protein ICV78_10465 [Tolypothrix sp. Co-bin9]|nr:hypothetical protein [Tolypothrix sp. Co-bin9]